MAIGWQGAGIPVTGMQHDPSDLTFTNLLLPGLVRSFFQQPECQYAAA